MKAEAQQGQMQPFSEADVATIRAKLGKRGNARDLALFETAISTMLRASDVTALTVADVTDRQGNVVSNFTTRQRKTLKPVTVTLTATARAALAALIAAGKLSGSDTLFARDDNAAKGREAISTRTFRSLVKDWADLAGYTDTRKFSGHSTRRTRAALIYRKTHDTEAVRQMLGHASLAHTSAYLGVTSDHAIAVAERYEI